MKNPNLYKSLGKILPNIPGLTTLRIRVPGVYYDAEHDFFMSLVAGLSQLEHLYINLRLPPALTSGNDFHLKHLAECQNLRSLELGKFLILISFFLIKITKINLCL